MKLTITANIKAEIARSKEALASDHPNIFNWHYLAKKLKAMGVPLMACDWPLIKAPGVLIVTRDEDFDEVEYEWRPDLTFADLPNEFDVMAQVSAQVQQELRHNPTLIRMRLYSDLTYDDAPIPTDWPWAPTSGRTVICFDEEWCEFGAYWQKPSV